MGEVQRRIEQTEINQRRLALLCNVLTRPDDNWWDICDQNRQTADDMNALAEMGYVEQPPKSTHWQITAKGDSRLADLAKWLMQ